MSGEVAHQEAPKAQEAARDHDRLKAEEPAAGGAMLLVGGPRMLSPAYVASLKRLADNAGMASLLQPSTVQRPRSPPA